MRDFKTRIKTLSLVGKLWLDQAFLFGNGLIILKLFTSCPPKIEKKEEKEEKKNKNASLWGASVNFINNSNFGCVRGAKICAYCLPREFAWIMWDNFTFMFTSRAVTIKLESVNRLSCSYLEPAGGEERMKVNAVAIFKHVLVQKKSVWKKLGSWTSHTVSALQNTYLFYYHFQGSLATASRIYTKHCLHRVLDDNAVFRKTSFSLTMCLLNV